MSKERWKAIPGWPYEVSDCGKVRSIDRVVITSNGQVRFWKGRVLRVGIYQEGYPIVLLRKNGKEQTTNVHSLVAQAFLPKAPSPKHRVDHKDDTRTNNHFRNLQWLTHAKNIKKGYRRKRYERVLQEI